jgi:hypothetical protein
MKPCFNPMSDMKNTPQHTQAPNYGKIPKPLFVVGVMAGATIITARADETVPTIMSPPAHTVLRYDENYSYLKDPLARTNLFDPVKYIPLDKAGDIYLTFGGQVRDRYEFFNNYLFGKGIQDPNGYNLIRTMLDADLHVTSYLRFFAEGISATEQGREGGPRPSDINAVDLYQAFGDFIFPIGADSSFTLRAGRQVIVFGAQRLIGVSDFTNVRRNSDGVRAILKTPGNILDVFYERPVKVLEYSFDNDIPGTFLTGIYDTWKVPGEWAKVMTTTLEAYALYVQRQSITFNQTTAGEKRYTFGTRLTANPKPFDFDLETDYQYGLYKGESTRAFSVAEITGYTLERALFKPRAFLGFDIASGGGQNHPGDTFDQLFPSGHDEFGIIDAIGRQNIIDVHPGATLKLLENQPGAKELTLLAQYRQFWRESDQDAVYTSSGSILRTGSGTSAMGVGGELDFQLNWQLDRHISAYTGYAHFFHGAFISATGPANDIDFVYTAMTFNF